MRLLLALLLMLLIWSACKTLGVAMATPTQTWHVPADLLLLSLALHGKSYNIVHA
jgi:uncharacterized integral membrane protein